MFGIRRCEVGDAWSRAYGPVVPFAGFLYLVTQRLKIYLTTKIDKTRASLRVQFKNQVYVGTLVQFK